MRLVKVIAVAVLFLLMLLPLSVQAQGSELELYENWRTPETIEVTHLVMADINNDLLEDVIYSYIENETHQYICVRNGTNQSVCWQREMFMGAQRGIQNIEAFDVDNDSAMEIIILNDDWKGYIFTGSDGFLEDTLNASESGIIAFGDLDSDGEIEMVVPELVMFNGSGRERLVVYDGKTKAIEWTSPPELLSHIVTQLLLDDVDSDGVQEILVETWEERLMVFDGVSKNVELNMTTNLGQMLAVDDLDHDGHKEIITGYFEWPQPGELPMECLKIINGTSYQVRATTTPMYNFGFLELYLSDMNGDNVTDIFVNALAGFDDTTIFVFNGSDYSLISQWECASEVTSIAAGDVDCDNVTDIVIGAAGALEPNATRSAGGRVHVLDRDFNERWASSSLGTIDYTHVASNGAGTSRMIVHGGDSIVVYSTTNSTADGGDVGEVPGFDMVIIISSVSVACILWRRRR